MDIGAWWVTLSGKGNQRMRGTHAARPSRRVPGWCQAMLHAALHLDLQVLTYLAPVICKSLYIDLLTPPPPPPPPPPLPSVPTYVDNKCPDTQVHTVVTCSHMVTSNHRDLLTRGHAAIVHGRSNGVMRHRVPGRHLGV